MVISKIPFSPNRIQQIVGSFVDLNVFGIEKGKRAICIPSRKRLAK